jgi:hypothetical protein
MLQTLRISHTFLSISYYSKLHRTSHISGNEFLMFCWLCISIYACNETNLMHYLSYSVITPLHVSGLLVVHHQEVTMYICDSWYVLYVLVDCQLTRPNQASLYHTDRQTDRQTDQYCESFHIQKWQLLPFILKKQKPVTMTINYLNEEVLPQTDRLFPIRPTQWTLPDIFVFVFVFCCKVLLSIDFLWFANHVSRYMHPNQASWQSTSTYKTYHLLHICIVTSWWWASSKPKICRCIVTE